MEETSWEIKVPILKNRIILRQLGFAIGIPFGGLIILLIIVEAYSGLFLVGATLILSYLLVQLVFRGTYDIRYVVSDKGILCENQPAQAKRVRKMSFLTVLLGLFSKNPTAAGVGMLSGTRIKEFYAWRRISKVKYIDRERCIMLHAGFAENTAVFCREENYTEIKMLFVKKIDESNRKSRST